ncbi:hypothetical protein FD724_37145 (plasmid) [Nostoc sp. C057]|nr:hypothetical protein FD724_37145 [Nostoc sp. C057]
MECQSSQRKGERRTQSHIKLYIFNAQKCKLGSIVGGDTRLIDAHHQALKGTLELIEQRYAYTRVTDNSNRHRKLRLVTWSSRS